MCPCCEQPKRAASSLFTHSLARSFAPRSQCGGRRSEEATYHVPDRPSSRRRSPITSGRVTYAHPHARGGQKSWPGYYLHEIQPLVNSSPRSTGVNVLALLALNDDHGLWQLKTDIYLHRLPGTLRKFAKRPAQFGLYACN